MSNSGERNTDNSHVRKFVEESAILEGRTTTVSPTEFAFVSTAAQIGDVRIFMRKLPGVLSR